MVCQVGAINGIKAGTSWRQPGAYALLLLLLLLLLPFFCCRSLSSSPLLLLPCLQHLLCQGPRAQCHGIAAPEASFHPHSGSAGAPALQQLAQLRQAGLQGTAKDSNGKGQRAAVELLSAASAHKSLQVSPSAKRCPTPRPRQPSSLPPPA